MIDNVTNDMNLITNSQEASQNSETQSVDAISKAGVKNPYATGKGPLIDESDISDEAVSLYEKEQEINSYKSYLDDISEEDANREVIDLIEKGIIDISDDELAESMFNNLALLNELFN